MAKIIIAGDAIVVKSDEKLEDIKTLEKYMPKALSLFEEEDGKKSEVFRVGSTAGQGSINQFGASFGSVAHDGSGLATITLPVPDGVEDVVSYASDLIGTAIVRLNQIEDGINLALSTVAAQKKQIEDNIVVQ